VFERFTDRARRVVILAQEEARTLGHHYIGTEHLLLGLLCTGDGLAARVMTDAGLTAPDVRSEIARLVGPGRPLADADALRAIGIDIDAVREHVERTFGPGALDRPSPRVRHRRRWRRSRCPDDGGHVPFSCRAKKVLELSLREALALRHNYIGTEHILLALLREGEGLAVQILVERGTRLDDLRTQILRAVGKVA
jgi:ATP-dependent Clp protease ATP-binding subunit ClpA